MFAAFESSRLLVIATVFAAAWVFARLAALATTRLLAWNDRRHAEQLNLSDKIAQIRRRETSVAIIRAGLTYAAFAAAAIVAVAQLSGGFDRLTALAGASFALVVAGFAVQRVLIDMIAGMSMFFERWFSVGDTIKIPTLELQGVVEDVSLRSTKLRTLNGEVIQIHNSQIPAVQVMPRGVKELTAEFFVRDRGQGEALVQRVSGLLPEGPTTFVRRPALDVAEDLSEGIVRIKVRAAVPPGREWLVEGLLSELLREQAEDKLILHGPIVLSDDEGANRSFARAAAGRSRAA
jgi:moderate conductance mechanosensitive channel